MLHAPTKEKLSEMKMTGMLAAWDEQAAKASFHKLSFDERLGLLVDAEWLHRKNRSVERKLREAKLRLPQSCIEDLDYSATRKLDRTLIRQLATGRWVQEHQNVIITGATGTGKTYVACALAHHACQDGHRAYYSRVSRLMDEFVLARADGTYARLLARLARMDILILDDWGLSRIDDTARHDLTEVMDDRHGLRSTIMTSQLPVSKWHDYIGEPTIADAICDRVVHNAHRIDLTGPSRRPAKKDQNGKTSS